MKKQIAKFLMLAALPIVLGLCVTSCKDDDEPSAEEKEQRAVEQQEQHNDAFAVLSQLADMSGASDDYLSQTFEPTIGRADETNANVRIVNTNSAEAAARSYANLTDASVDENTTTYTYKNDAVGTLTYNKVTDGTAWATVDVSIKQMPHLQKIVYRSPEQAGDNGKFDGRAYYRFGDVVSRTKDGVTEYWICVRPAFGIEGKEDSHWVCLNTMPESNIFTYTYESEKDGVKTKKTWRVPTKLGTNKEQMQNLAEMLYAMLYPTQWKENIDNNSSVGMLGGPSGLPIFHDFHSTNIKYNNQYFFNRVCKGWDDHNIWSLAMNTDKNTVQNLLTTSGLQLLYNGYSWWTSSSWSCSLYQMTYTNGTDAKTKNMHTQTSATIKKSMENLTFDCREMGKATGNYIGFFNNDGHQRWCIRHATGKELSSTGQYEVRQPIPGVNEVYRYYRDVVPTTDLLSEPEVAVEFTDEKTSATW